MVNLSPVFVAVTIFVILFCRLERPCDHFGLVELIPSVIEQQSSIIYSDLFWLAVAVNINNWAD